MLLLRLNYADHYNPIKGHRKSSREEKKNNNNNSANSSVYYAREDKENCPRATLELEVLLLLVLYCQTKCTKNGKLNENSNEKNSPNVRIEPTPLEL